MVNSIDINIDSRCTASCTHCCFSCSPNSIQSLSNLEIYMILDYIKLNKSIKYVSITGGEPLLRYEMTKKIIKESHNAGKKVSLISNGFWGGSLDKAVKISNELKESGLDAITISFDDYHKEFVPVQNIRNVLHALKQANIRVALNITVDKSHKKINLVEELGEAIFNVDIAIMPLCRAGNSKEIPESELYFQCEKDSKMRCPAGTWEFAIHHDGFVYPCCSPMVFESELRIGNIRKQSLNEIEYALNTNALLFILKTEGLQWFIKKLEINIENKNFVNT